jgi:hypothetical protein
MIMRLRWVHDAPQWNQNTAQRPLTSDKHIKNDHFRSSNKPSRGALAFERRLTRPLGLQKGSTALYTTALYTRIVSGSRVHGVFELIWKISG